MEIFNDLYYSGVNFLDVAEKLATGYIAAECVLSRRIKPLATSIGLATYSVTARLSSKVFRHLFGENDVINCASNSAARILGITAGVATYIFLNTFSTDELNIFNASALGIGAFVTIAHYFSGPHRYRNSTISV